VVIGENPSTGLSRDWWSYWDNVKGFNLRLFESVYEAERTAVAKCPVSNTRLRLNRLRKNGLACLETNAFSNERADGRGAGVSNSKLLQFFLRSLPELKAIIAHGTEAAPFLKSPNIQKGVRTYATRHFRNESYATLDEISREIRAL
jgi:hypothetical protein